MSGVNLMLQYSFAFNLVQIAFTHNILTVSRKKILQFVHLYFTFMQVLCSATFAYSA